MNRLIYIYDIPTNKWSSRITLPASDGWYPNARAQHTAEVSTNGTLFLLFGLRPIPAGGQFGSTLALLSDITSINLQSIQTDPSPVPSRTISQSALPTRAYHQSALVTGPAGPLIVIYGGLASPHSALGSWNQWVAWDVQQAATVDLAVGSIPSSSAFDPGPRFMGSMVGVGSRAYLYGGYNKPASGTDVLYPPDMWMLDVSVSGGWTWTNVSRTPSDVGRAGWAQQQAVVGTGGKILLV
ncbi:hypothetical protein HK104_005753, partial [Borealophlyctis nickersoniae]